MNYISNVLRQSLFLMCSWNIKPLLWNSSSQSVVSWPVKAISSENWSQVKILKVTPDLLNQNFCLNKTWFAIRFENHCPQRTLDEHFDPVYSNWKMRKLQKAFHLHYFTHVIVIIQNSKKNLRSERK